MLVTAVGHRSSNKSAINTEENMLKLPSNSNGKRWTNNMQAGVLEDSSSANSAKQINEVLRWKQRNSDWRKK